MLLNKNIAPLHYPSKVKLVGYQDAPLYLGVIADEIQAPVVPPCFLGAWYRKAVSSKDMWLGIEATITLPDFILDEAWKENTRYLENPSIYFGGNAGAESDAGLTWTLVGQTPECLAPSTESLAFRPFWRYIDGNKNTWQNSNYRHPEHYYLPGDKLRISVFSPRPNFLQMQIEVIESTNIPKYVERRKSWLIENDMPANFVSEEFPSVGHGITLSEYKRVNAIDQARNEAKPARATKTEIFAATWHEVYLFRQINGAIKKVPFTKYRYASMACPLSEGFTLSYEGVDNNLGGEVVSIHPSKANK
ncbi:MAG: hypothetical protein K0Q49_562 [Haloplasmataceae bacterium]|jgi:hypothetical protein|nr:hypothetical protein [Haloplasmataceae bacterium]